MLRYLTQRIFSATASGCAFLVKLSLPHNFRNPGAFDYVGYLAENGVNALGSVKVSDVEILPGFSGNRFELWRTRLHRSLIGKIHTLWPPEQAALVDTIMLGDDSFLGKDTRTNFQRTGTYHVLVVSGLKVGILALVMFWLLRHLRVNDFVASAITVFLTVSYAVLTDVGAPVWRAMMIAADAAISLGYISTAAAKLPAFVTAMVLRAAGATVHWMGGLKISDARVATPELWVGVAACRALLLAMILSRRRPLFSAAGLAAVAVTAIWISIVPPSPQFHAGVLEVTAIDVGQGD